MKPTDGIWEMYSDESGINGGERYQAIAVVSGCARDLKCLGAQLATVLSHNAVHELKWNRIRPGGTLNAAKSFASSLITAAWTTSIKLDVLVWDMNDSRHRIAGRDDIANLERMYFHCARQVALRQCQNEWRWFPDENNAIDWNGLQSFLNRTVLERKGPAMLQLFRTCNRAIEIAQLYPTDSKQDPLVQCADLFAGLVRYTRTRAQDNPSWMATHRDDLTGSLFDDHTVDTASVNPGKAEQARRELVRYVNDLCKRNKLGVSLMTRGYLCTMNNNGPINLWHYVPQTPLDRAPVKSR